ncbi:hypothetical protein CCHR01_16273 [Colletotrichum chrysophilum]|uniref:Uncharacterized protein n=1 Tax=Colletotrichum chrysophilum TaxID=1836956 RepID=A0AAD9E7Y5_9PEZI|nr:hypothetical protein CCHR01_16273 [Colletotrichum chrysophilum]
MIPIMRGFMSRCFHPSRLISNSSLLILYCRSLFTPKNNTTMSIMEYEYFPLPTGRHIRAIHLLPSPAFDSPLYCYMRELCLDEDGNAFEAISYTWGRPVLDCVLHLSRQNCSLRITQSLSDALRRFRLKDRRRILWADAVCINQQDHLEKESQIPLMAHIYQRAEAVLVWLGDSTRAEEAMRALSWATRSAGEELDEGQKGKITAFLDTLLKQPWFGRRWIIQEVVRNHDVTIHCGTTSLSWVKLIAVLSRLGKDTGTSNQQAMDALIQMRNLWKRIVLLEDSGAGHTLLENFHAFSHLDCGEDRDRVYALATLSSDVSMTRELKLVKRSTDSVGSVYWANPKPQDRVFHVVPDYEPSTEHVYTKFAAEITRNGLFSWLLCRTWHRHPFNELPAWAPDWRIAAPEKPYFLKELLQGYSGREEWASRGLPMMADWPKTRLRGDSLRLRSFMISHSDTTTLFHDEASLKHSVYIQALWKSKPLEFKPGEDIFEWVDSFTRSTSSLLKTIAQSPFDDQDVNDACFSLLSHLLGYGPNSTYWCDDNASVAEKLRAHGVDTAEPTFCGLNGDRFVVYGQGRAENGRTFLAYTPVDIDLTSDVIVRPENSFNEYTLGEMGRHNVVIAVLPDAEYGLSTASAVARSMLISFPNVRAGLMVGIAGGAPLDLPGRDIRLGDIVVSSPRDGHGGVLQYDFGKIIQGQPLQPTRFLNQPPDVLRAAVAGLKAEIEEEGHNFDEEILKVFFKKPRLRAKYSRPPPETDKLFHSHIVFNPDSATKVTEDESFVYRAKRTDEEDDPAIFYGLIASANQLMKDAVKRDKLAAEKGILCFEMESAGLMNHFPCLVIRGVCDYSDTHKNKQWQGYAAMTAAAYGKKLAFKAAHEGELRMAFRDICTQVYNDLCQSEDSSFNPTESRAKKLEGCIETMLKYVYEPTITSAIENGHRAWACTAMDEWDDFAQEVLDHMIEKGIQKDFENFQPFPTDGGFYRTASRTVAKKIYKLACEAIESEASKHQTLVLIIDALDECSSTDDIETFVPLLLKLARSRICNFKVFLASRSEVAIRYTLELEKEVYENILHKVAWEVITMDIKVFLRDELAAIKDRWNKRKRNDPSQQLSALWPGKSRLGTLVDLADGLFLVAATNSRFIGDSMHGPEERLTIIINTAQASGVTDRLSPIYLPILWDLTSGLAKADVEILLNMFRRVIGSVIVLSQPLPVDSLAGLLGVNVTQVEHILDHLVSVIDVPDDRLSPILPYHQSFGEFLFGSDARDFTFCESVGDSEP